MIRFEVFMSGNGSLATQETNTPLYFFTLSPLDGPPQSPHQSSLPDPLQIHSHSLYPLAHRISEKGSHLDILELPTV